MHRYGIILLSIGLILVIGLAALPSGAQDFGVNWSGVFYDNTNLSGTGSAPINNINGLNFNWPGAPIVNGIVPTVNGAAVPENNFSARFSSTQTFAAGRYQFTLTVDDGARVLVDGQEALNVPPAGVQTRTFERDLTEGAHSLTVEFIELTAGAVLQFQWTLAGAAPTAGPSPTTGPSPTPGPTATPAPTGLPAIPPGALSATVIRATVLNVRAAPYLGAERVATIRRGQTYPVLGRDPDARWFLLQLSDRQGWAFGYYLAVNGNEFNAPVTSSFVLQGNPAAQSGVVAQTNAVMKLRAQPTVYSEQIGRIPWGDIMAVTGRTPGDGAWWRVVWRDTTGWVFAPYLTLIEGSTADIPTIAFP